MTATGNKIPVLLIVQNNPLPDDQRVIREAVSLVKGGYDVYAISPRGKTASARMYYEEYEGVKIYRYPNLDAKSLLTLPLEYINAIVYILALTVWIFLRHGVKSIHAANPPDFILPLLSFMKLLGVKFIFDQHDKSVEVFTSKLSGTGVLSRVPASLLRMLEKLSYRLSDFVIVTNESAKEYASASGTAPGRIVVIGNSPRLSELPGDMNRSAREKGRFKLGYIGIMGNESGTGNLVALARNLVERGMDDFEILVVGSGPALESLKELVENENLGRFFDFRGFVPFGEAAALLAEANAGIIPWDVNPKHELHTAAKAVDYMSLGLPVLALQLREVMKVADGCGIFSSDFYAMTDAVLELRDKPEKAELLGRNGMKKFSSELCWERQELSLLGLYNRIFNEGEV